MGLDIVGCQNEQELQLQMLWNVAHVSKRVHQLSTSLPIESTIGHLNLRRNRKQYPPLLKMDFYH